VEGPIARSARVAVALAVTLVPAAASAQPCPAGRLLLLTNGRIHTMDTKRTVVSKVRIAGGRFVEVGDAASATGGCTDTIDLRGRTVIPGMIDNHFHVQLVGSRPGYETRTIETAFSIAEVQTVIRERGYAECVEEIEVGVSSVAAPVRIGNLGVPFSVGATGPIRRFTGRQREKIGIKLIEVAGRIAANLQLAHAGTLS
jgi:hypothetical protein